MEPLEFDARLPSDACAIKLKVSECDEEIIERLQADSCAPGFSKTETC